MKVELKVTITDAVKDEGLLFLNRLNKHLQNEPNEIQYIIKATSGSSSNLTIGSDEEQDYSDSFLSKLWRRIR